MHLLLSAALFVSQCLLPQYIDLGRLPPHDPSHQKLDHWTLGRAAFNSAPEIGSFILYLKSKYPIDCVVETGTNLGATSAFFSLHFSQVHTIELLADVHKQATANLSHCPNVYCHLGSSEKVLEELLPELERKPLLFYLDAHWQQHWPLLAELDEISKTHRDNCIIVIDDFKVPGRKDIIFDVYGKCECSYEYIRKHLDKVFTSYTYHFIIPYNKNCRAKFVAIPQKWIEEKDF